MERLSATLPAYRIMRESIATIGALLVLRPQDSVNVSYAPKRYDSLEDRGGMLVKVDSLIRSDGTIVGVSGPVIKGHERYLGLIATLFVRLDDSDWTRDQRTQANFKIGPSQAVLNGRQPYYHPEGSEIVGYPQFSRFGSLEILSGADAGDRMPYERVSWSIRSVFRWNNPGPSRKSFLYEERITLHKWIGAAAALQLAEAESSHYVADGNKECLGLFQVSQVLGEAGQLLSEGWLLGEGWGVASGEVFSLFRESDLEPKAYLERFFDTGFEYLGRKAE